MNLYEKMLAIMQEVQKLQKDDHVSFGSNNYKALSEEKVTEIMRQKLIQNRIVVYPFEQTCSRNGQITHVDVKYRMVNVDDPTDFIEIASCGDGADSQDMSGEKAARQEARGARSTPNLHKHVLLAKAFLQVDCESGNSYSKT